MWDRLSALPVVVESYELERLSARLAYGFERVTTRIRLLGAGAEGLGEDVSPYEGEDDTLHVAGPVLPLAGEWTLGSFCDRLAELDQWPVPPRWDVGAALAQLGVRVRRARSRAQPGGPRAARASSVASRAPVRFVNSLGLGDPPTFDPIRRRLERHPGLRFKLDATPAWTPELIDELAATGAVEIIDFKGHYGLEIGELPALLAMYERVDRGVPGRAARGRARPARGRASCSSPRRTASPTTRRSTRSRDLDATPLPPRAVNIKPCRVGDLRSLLDVYAACEARGLVDLRRRHGRARRRARPDPAARLAVPPRRAQRRRARAATTPTRRRPTCPPSPLPAAPAPVGFRRRY